MKYLKLPINFSSAIQGNPIASCSLEESIAQSIMMQITTRYGEVVGRPGFGSEIWELEFDQLIKVYEWEQRVKQSLTKTIAEYEKRLYDVDVKVNLSEFEKEGNFKRRREVKRKADFLVTGKILYKDLPFYFHTTIYISPLSQ